MKILAPSVAMPLLLVACAASLFTGCQQRSEPEPETTARVFEFTRGELAGDTGAGFHPVEDAEFPTLPRSTDKGTTEQQLASQALQVALSEHARGELSLEEVEVRKQDIMAFWLPQYHILLEIIAENEAAKDQVHQYLLAQAKHRAHWNREQDAMQAEWDERIRQEELRVLPLVPPDLQARLVQQQRRADRQRSRVGQVAP